MHKFSKYQIGSLNPKMSTEHKSLIRGSSNELYAKKYFGIEAHSLLKCNEKENIVCLLYKVELREDRSEYDKLIFIATRNQKEATRLIQIHNVKNLTVKQLRNLVKSEGVSYE